MSDKSFLDSNIFIYAYDQREPVKQSVADNLIRGLTISGEAVASYQVIHEFFSWALVKGPAKMPQDEAQRYLNVVFRPMYIVASSSALVSDAIRIQDRYRLSWYDSLIVAAAQQAGCDVLYTEDFQHGQQFGTVRVQNPFL
jgi:predicted nucleic acid-binding protein